MHKVQVQSNLVSSPLDVSPPTSPFAKLTLGTDFPQVLEASFDYLANWPLAKISGWINGGELTRFDCTIIKSYTMGATTSEVGSADTINVDGRQQCHKLYSGFYVHIRGYHSCH
jgi:hypothetical protein